MRSKTREFRLFFLPLVICMILVMDGLLALIYQTVNPILLIIIINILFVMIITNEERLMRLTDQLNTLKQKPAN